MSKRSIGFLSDLVDGLGESSYSDSEYSSSAEAAAASPDKRFSFGADLSVIGTPVAGAANDASLDTDLDVSNIALDIENAELAAISGDIAAQMALLRSSMEDKKESSPHNDSQASYYSDSESASDSDSSSDSSSEAQDQDGNVGDFSIVYKGPDADKIQFFRKAETPASSFARSESAYSYSDYESEDEPEKDDADVSVVSQAPADVSAVSQAPANTSAVSQTPANTSVLSTVSEGYSEGEFEASMLRPVTPPIAPEHADQSAETRSVASTRAGVLQFTAPVLSDNSDEDDDDDDDDDDLEFLLSRASKLHSAIKMTDFTPSKAKAEQAGGLGGTPSRHVRMASTPSSFATTDEVRELQLLEDAVSQLSRGVRDAKTQEREAKETAADEEIRSLRNQLYVTQRDLEDRRKSRALRNEELVTLRASVKQLKDALKAKELRALTAEMEAKQAAVGSVQGMQGDLASLMATATANIAALEEQIEVVKSEKEREKLQIVLEQLRLERERGELQSKMEGAVEELGEENAVLTRRAGELDSRNRNLERQHMEVEKELRQQLAELYTERARAQDTVAALEAKLSKTSQAWDLQRVRLETQITELQTQLEVLNLKKATMEQKYSKKLESQESVAAAAAAITQELQDENTALADALIASSRDQVVKAAEAAEAAAQVETLRTQLETKEASLVAQIAALEAQVAESDAQIADLRETSAAAQDDARATIEQLESQIAILQKSLDSKRATEDAQASELRVLLTQLKKQQAAAAATAQVDDQMALSAQDQIRLAMTKAKNNHAIAQRDRKIAKLTSQLEEMGAMYAEERAVIQAGMSSMRATLLQYARDAAAAHSANQAQISAAIEQKSELQASVSHLREKVSRVRRHSRALEADAAHIAASSPLRPSPTRAALARYPDVSSASVFTEFNPTGAAVTPSSNAENASPNRRAIDRDVYAKMEAHKAALAMTISQLNLNASLLMSPGADSAVSDDDMGTPAKVAPMDDHFDTMLASSGSEYGSAYSVASSSSDSSGYSSAYSPLPHAHGAPYHHFGFGAPVGW